MEWDTVEGAGLLQQFESSIITALVNLRQKQWKDCTAVVSDIRQLIGQLRSDFDSGIGRINAEKSDLIKEIEKRDFLIEGKDLEILGLRHQLRSMLMSKAVCTKCACEIVAPEIQSTKVAQETHKSRKRARFNLSVSASLESSTNPPVAVGATSTYFHRRPSEKRRCIAHSDGHISEDCPDPKSSSKSKVPNLLVAETQCDMGICDSDGSSLTSTLTRGIVNEAVNRSSVESKSPVAIPPLPDSAQGDKVADSIAYCPINMGAFSPPSQAFDASKVIRGAVNHLDLADYEPSIVDPPRSSEPSKQSKARAYSRHSQGKTHQSRRYHKPSCRHYQPQQQKVENRKYQPSPTKVDLISDVTGADLTTFPSISTSGVLADAESHQVNDGVPPKSIMPPPAAPLGAASTASRQNGNKRKCNSTKPPTDVFPSLGGSPTSLGAAKQVGVKKQLENSEELSKMKSPRQPAKAPTSSVTGSPGAPVSENEASKNVKVAVTCRDCEKYYQAAGYSAEEISKRVQESGKHRHPASPPGYDGGNLPSSTPEGFWNLGEITASANVGAENEATKSTADHTDQQGIRRLRRRRPLDFPKPPL
uniref:PHD-type domain-containing protein n=2 Tax=Mesocestoides corti TaxID=53468 RepID=A0A5K3FY75_MESCO